MNETPNAAEARENLLKAAELIRTAQYEINCNADTAGHGPLANSGDGAWGQCHNAMMQILTALYDDDLAEAILYLVYDNGEDIKYNTTLALQDRADLEGQ